MCNEIKKSLLLALIIISAIFIIGDSVFSAGTQSGYILTQPIGSRPMGMGDAFTAVSNDVNALYWNPAGLCDMVFPEVSLLTANSFEDTAYTVISYAKANVKNTFGIGTSFLMFNGGNIEVIYPFGTPIIYNAASDYIWTLSYSKKITGSINFGINYKTYFSTLLGMYHSNSTMVDMGGLWKMKFGNSSNIAVGLCLQNYGSKVEYLSAKEELPQVVRTGISYQIGSFKNLFTVAGDFVNITGEDMKMNFGIEYAFARLLFLRTGYKSYGSSESGLNFGVGINVRKYKFEYSAGTTDSLGTIGMFAFSYLL